MSTQSDPLKVTAQELQSEQSRYTALLVAGCSFSAGDSHLSTARKHPITWSHFFLEKLEQFTQYVNLAMSGGGNFAASANVVNFLECNRSYSSQNTLILFNITGFDRVDVMCDREHPDCNQTFSWSHVVDHSWISSGGFLPSNKSWLNTLNKNMGLDCIKRINAIALVQMISYLELRKFRYGFMIMDDNASKDMPEWLHDWLRARLERKIDLAGQNMYEFCRDRENLAPDLFHPSERGHELIAKHVITYCKKNAIC